MPTNRNYINIWIEELKNKKHLEAVKYIEENVDLIDVDLQKFMDNCPNSCQLEVYEMLLKAGIDMKDYVMNQTLKQWDKYIHDANLQLHQYYKINYKQEWDELTDILTLKKDWLEDSIILDTIPTLEEV